MKRLMLTNCLIRYVELFGRGSLVNRVRFGVHGEQIRVPGVPHVHHLYTLVFIVYMDMYIRMCGYMYI